MLCDVNVNVNVTVNYQKKLRLFIFHLKNEKKKKMMNKNEPKKSRGARDKTTAPPTIFNSIRLSIELDTNLMMTI